MKIPSSDDRRSERAESGDLVRRETRSFSGSSLPVFRMRSYQMVLRKRPGLSPGNTMDSVKVGKDQRNENPRMNVRG